jgi:hypothetical protein
MLKCGVCKINDAIYDDYWGYLPCRSCQEKQARLAKPGGQVEFVGEDIKLQRQKYHRDIIQSNRKGESNKEYVDVYGADRARHEGYTEKEIKNAKYVYGEEESSFNKHLK